MEYDREYETEYKLANETAAQPAPLSVHESALPGAFLRLDFLKRLTQQRTRLRVRQLTSAHLHADGKDPGMLRVC